jgi:hypothetical protein
MHAYMSNKEKLGIFLEENRKLSKDLNGHLGIENTHIQNGEKEGCNLFLDGRKLTLVRGFC